MMIIKNINIHLNFYSWIGKLTANLGFKEKNKKGNIVFLSSILWFCWTKFKMYKKYKIKENMSYAIIKGGINTLTKSMASYYGRNGIRVNAIYAGGVYDNQPAIYKKL